ncbi:MAG: hypothetical protein V2A79_08820 [Planctomycetota bacterium]
MSVRISVRSRRMICWLAVAAVLGAARVGAANRNPQWWPGNGLPGVDGGIEAVAAWDPDGAGPEPEWIVVGGYFRIAGDVFVNNIAAWDGTRWHSMGGGINGGVRALAIYAGEVIAGGYFTTAGGVACASLARWNGSIWQPLGPGIDGTVLSLTEHDGTLIVGGEFRPVAGGGGNIARWDGSQWFPVGSGLGDDVCSLTVYNGEIIAGRAHGYPVARWDGDQWHPLGSSADDRVHALAVYQGELIAGGCFYRIGGTYVNCLAKWDGNQWLPLGDGTGDCVKALTLHNGELIAGGDFVSAGGVVANGIAAWDGSTWRPIGAGIGRTLSLAVCNGFLVSGGFFSSAGGAVADHVARWDGTQWHSLGRGTDRPVGALAAYDGELVAGGSFVTIGTIDANRIARWDGLQWHALGSGVTGPGPYYRGVSCFSVYDYELVAGGSFESAGEVSADNIARWNGSTWESMGSGLTGGDYPEVYDLAIYHGDLIAAGGFTSAGGVACRRIARWNGSQWGALGNGAADPGGLTSVYALTVFNGDLIAGGSCVGSGEVPCTSVARWDGAEWHLLGDGLSWDNGYPADVFALVDYNGSLIAGGYFTNTGGTSTRAIARWDGAAWHPLGSGMGGTADFLPAVRALAIYEGDLIAGGDFASAGGLPCNFVARWDGDQWYPLGDGVGGSEWAPVLALTAYHGELVAGGVFTTAGDHVSAYWARWGCDCNSNGRSDADDTIAGTSTDTNGDWIPDECQPVFLGSADSVGTACTLTLGSGGSEPRRGGIRQLNFHFDLPPADEEPAMAWDRSCPSPPSFVPYGGAAIMDCTPNGNELECRFTPALEDRATYEFDLSALTGYPAGTDLFEISGLIGDVDGNLTTDKWDRRALHDAWGTDDCRSDLNEDGTVGAADHRLVIVKHDHCAP